MFYPRNSNKWNSRKEKASEFRKSWNSNFFSFFLFSQFLFLLTSSFLCANCCDCFQPIDISVGWRRDNVKWKTDCLEGSYINAVAKSHITFKDINSYAVSAKARWVAAAYFIRLSAEYGFTDKGRAEENFKIRSPYLYFPVEVHTSDPIKRKSEVYDFNGAVGFPFSFYCSRFSIVPVLGFSYHRQHLRVKADERCCSRKSHYCNCFYNYYKSSSCSPSSSSYFDVCSSNPFRFNPSSNPFSSSSSSDPVIADELGLRTDHQTSNYRFTWYGFYIGLDLAYALDCCWSLFSELEYHFYDNCHRKRKSWTGVAFVDDYHKKGWAYGFNGVVGATYCICNCWYGIVSVDFRWWKAPSEHDHINWRMVGAKAGLGYVF